MIMIIKKSILCPVSCNSIQTLCSPSSTSSRGHNRGITRPSISLNNTSTYATFAPEQPDTTSDASRNHVWPSSKPNHVPTPYEILESTRGKPYNKTRFNELVKIYHPDKNGVETIAIPLDVRMERYRLIVAAHAILSDPLRRGQYDRYGAGWAGSSTLPQGTDTHGRTRGFYDPKGPMNNATWEDWERYYQYKHFGDDGIGKDGKRRPQEPVFLSNTAFIAVIVMFAAIAGVGQATRAENASLNFIEQRDAHHKEAGEMLRKVQQNAKVDGRDARVQKFLMERDPEAYFDESVRKMYLEPDICESDGAVKRNFRPPWVKKE
ncbi:hypothetical protein K402DRAFT_32960 [Aulographum hederae CBS 113979]|uniref:J domain-containing protein n=1 Tax=Aulographum hederae CBS 113979 TaxID=1176131 RepID=A0A6G1H519_9PEZI|nr:hypothetical protein K402DRAFT_32960 [Aulographum hederae CBS 113979]